MFSDSERGFDVLDLQTTLRVFSMIFGEQFYNTRTRVIYRREIARFRSKIFVIRWSSQDIIRRWDASRYSNDDDVRDDIYKFGK